MQTVPNPLNQTFAIKRIYKDIQELQNEAIPWVSICIPDPQNPFMLHGNIMIQDGPYKDVLIHLIIRLPPDYPLSPPAANIAPGHPFNRRFHEHVIGGGSFGASICTDLLSNFQWYFGQFEFNGRPVVSGWSPVYTLGSILMQLQIFFADPDLPKALRPSQEEVETMKKKVQEYTYQITTKDENSEKHIVHSYDNPYPPFLHQICQSRYVQNLSDEEKSKKLAGSKITESKIGQFPKQDQKDYDDVMAVKNIIDEYSLVNVKNVSNRELKFEICNKLICPVTKNTILNDPMPLFGYPIFIKTDEFNRLWPTPVIEIISKEGMDYYIQQPAQVTYKRNTGNYTSVFGQEYNYWLPLYINEKHFAKVKGAIFDTITELYRKISPEENPKNFYPEMILKVLPPILVKTVIHMLKDDLHQSLAALDAYSQFYWLFMKLVSLYPEVQQKIDEEAEKFLHEEDFRHKKKVGDLGEFMFKLSLSKYSIHNTEMNEALLGEFLARQVSWAKGRDKDLRKSEISNLVKKFMKATTVACQFFLVQFETTKLMVNDSVRAELEEGFGVVNPVMLNRFMRKMNWIRRYMNDDWTVLIKNIGLENVITSEEEMKAIIELAFDQGEETYDRWANVKCSITGIDHTDPSLPVFGYIVNTYPNLILNPNLVCKEAMANQRGVQWLPLYMNAKHFERVKSIFNSHLVSIYKLMPISLKEREKIGSDIAKVAVKVFCRILTSCIDRLSILRRLQMNMLRAYLQLVWTFWKLLEQNAKMRELLDQEVELFKTQKSYTKDMSWLEWRECVVKLLLSQKGRDSLDLYYSILEELVKREARSSTGTIFRHEGFDCQKLGKFNQEAIKLFLSQVLLTKVVLEDKYRAQLECRNGTLRSCDVDLVRSQTIDILKERFFNLWKPTLEVLEAKELVKGPNEMSALTRDMHRAVVQSEREEIRAEEKKKKEKLLSQSPLGGLGLKFAVKIEKTTPKTKENGN